MARKTISVEKVTESVIPEDLKKYLEKDNEISIKIEEKISDLNAQIAELNSEKVESEKSFEERLASFKKELEEEKKKVFEDFKNRENAIIDEKTKISGIKTNESKNQTSYIKSLKNISAEYDSKIDSVNEAIKACGENESLKMALDEEKNKKIAKLEELFDDRKKSLDDVLIMIGEKKETIDIPLAEEEKVETPLYVEPAIEPVINEVKEYDNEIVSHISREDVVNDLFGSEEIMENHVFPYLRKFM